MRSFVLSAAFFLLTGAASADILEWQDATGVQHYTNLQAGIPKQYRETARVVIVDEAARQQPAAASEHAAPVPQGGGSADGSPPFANTATDRSEIPLAYLEGLQAGLALGRATPASANVNIAGPLAVSSASSAAPGPSAFVPYYSFAPSWAYPLVTTSFDRGRSRHLTLRMLLEDQFMIDREGPYVFAPLGPPPLSVNLSPFLPRGLPYGSLPYGFPGYARVVAR